MLMLVTKNCGISSSRIVKCYKYMILILSNQVWLLDSSITDTWVLITNTYIYEEVRVSNTRDWNNGVQYLRNNSWEHWRKSKVCLLGSISPTNGDDSQSSTPIYAKVSIWCSYTLYHQAGTGLLPWTISNIQPWNYYYGVLISNW